jgi:hypothetical protein
MIPLNIFRQPFISLADKQYLADTAQKRQKGYNFFARLPQPSLEEYSFVTFFGLE